MKWVLLSNISVQEMSISDTLINRTI